jgi:hypothetical protein
MKIPLDVPPRMNVAGRGFGVEFDFKLEEDRVMLFVRDI